MIDQKGIFNNIYKNLVSPILKEDTGIDAEYLTNFSLSLLTFSSNNRNWPIISKIIESLNQEFCVVDAFNWHCAYFWEHFDKNIRNKEVTSCYNRLINCIAIPILVSRPIIDYKNIASYINECS